MSTDASPTAEEEELVRAMQLTGRVVYDGPVIQDNGHGPLLFLYKIGQTTWGLTYSALTHHKKLLRVLDTNRCILAVIVALRISIEEMLVELGELPAVTVSPDGIGVSVEEVTEQAWVAVSTIKGAICTIGRSVWSRPKNSAAVSINGVVAVIDSDTPIYAKERTISKIGNVAILALLKEHDELVMRCCSPSQTEKHLFG
jgi:hypothetical protein